MMMRSLVTARVRRRERFCQIPIASTVPRFSSIFSSKNDPPMSSIAFNSSKKLTLSLTPAEDSLFAFLEYIQRIYAPTTHLRVAGGWVRDKLRGTPCEDIDIALDNVKGAKFATYITTFQRSRRLPRSAVGIVKANAAKYKNCEVATVTIDGARVDFVHLRAEHYNEASRVPTALKFASPAEDARQRDLTMNALFYNIHTKEVEDHTGTGVQDLRDGLVRTPREPLQTFLDDPLRVLRALRFACEFKFTLDPAIEKVVLEERAIRETMKRKVSRERIGSEVRKMLSGTDPARAFQFLRKLNLLDLIFNDTVELSGDEPAVRAGETTGFPYPPRAWTASIQHRASHYLHYLQRSRLALAKCQISNVEATGALLTPLFLETLPKIILDDSSRLGLDDLPEHELVASSLEFLDRQAKHIAAVDANAIIEMLKVHLKWPKPAGKRVAKIIEAIALYPERERARTNEASRKHGVQHFLWLIEYHSVLHPALTILAAHGTLKEQNMEATTSENEHHLLQKYIEMATACVKSNGSIKTPSQTRRLDGKTVRMRLGCAARDGIARALRILQVWEKLYPDASMEEELAFLDRMAPLVRESS
ncbi:hypothetical protein PsorP6_010465 [Peronosclerospora sorghi]|uniref:Uncharacterized protein n=1 Tax=Peronosclerospora sorghi TaxID=230839 RepID=A0ACC0VW37_9STRA|nr:hypothetical protein PsorP6_010465 [Peronosclerospora sorghi]